MQRLYCDVSAELDAPDKFYTHFFEALLAAGAGEGEAQIREALEATRRSAYTLYVKELPLT